MTWRVNGRLVTVVYQIAGRMTRCIGEAIAWQSAFPEHRIMIYLEDCV